VRFESTRCAACARTAARPASGHAAAALRAA
jgi:hypothetical protein